MIQDHLHVFLNPRQQNHNTPSIISFRDRRHGISTIIFLTPPASDRTSSDQQQAQKRRAVRNDASERTDLDVPPTSRLRTEGFTYERERVGSPPLALLPLQDSPINENNFAYLQLQKVLPQIEDVLRDYHVQIDGDQDMDGQTNQIEFVHRTREHESLSNHDLTVLIPAVWEEARPQIWLQVVDRVREILVQHQYTEGIKVEVIGRRFFKALTLDVVEDDHPIVSRWKDLRPQIHTIIDQSQHLRDRWCSIGVIRQGHTDWTGSEPPLPTVVAIMVDWDVNPLHWQDAEFHIKDLLLAYNLPNVGVDFSRGELVTTNFPLRQPMRAPKTGDILDKHAYSKKMEMGSDFGPREYFEKAPGEAIPGPSATIGGFINATDCETGTVTRMGLTNYHAVRAMVPGFSYTVSTNSNKQALVAPALKDSPLESQSAPLHESKIT